MDYAQAFLVGLIFSFLGSIPPGTLNIGVLQLGLQGKTNIALRFALAVSLIEYPYTWIAVAFETWIAQAPMVVANFKIITAVVMTAIGAFNLLSVNKPTKFSEKFNASGFRRGLVLSILNPMAIPFWIAVTAWLRAQGWINLNSSGKKHIYILGTSVGAMLLLLCFIYLAQKLAPVLQHSKAIKLVPGLVLLVLGLYAFGSFLAS